MTGDPRWMTARFPGVCAGGSCSDPIARGDQIFYYPSTRSAFVGSCAEACARDFSSACFDEAAYSGEWR